MALLDNKKGSLGDKYKPINLFRKTNNYDEWFGNNESTNTTSKSDKQEGKRLRGKILPLNKLLTRRSKFLAEIKAGNNSYKLKNEIRQILYLLYQHNKITKKVYNNLIKSL